MLFLISPDARERSRRQGPALHIPQEAAKRRRPKSDPARILVVQVVVQGLPWSYTGDQLTPMFEQYGQIAHADVVYGRDGRSRVSAKKRQSEKASSIMCFDGRYVRQAVTCATVCFRHGRLIMSCCSRSSFTKHLKRLARSLVLIRVCPCW